MEFCKVLKFGPLNTFRQLGYQMVLGNLLIARSMIASKDKSQAVESDD